MYKKCTKNNKQNVNLGTIIQNVWTWKFSATHLENFSDFGRVFNGHGRGNDGVDLLEEENL